MLSKSGSWNDLISFIKNESIRHISFDFWNTIAQPNPLFKKKRSELIQTFCINEFSKYEIDSAFSKIGKKYKDNQQEGNFVIPPVELLKLVINEINPNINLNFH